MVDLFAVEDDGPRRQLVVGAGERDGNLQPYLLAGGRPPLVLARPARQVAGAVDVRGVEPEAHLASAVDLLPPTATVVPAPDGKLWMCWLEPTAAEKAAIKAHGNQHLMGGSGPQAGMARMARFVLEGVGDAERRARVEVLRTAG